MCRTSVSVANGATTRLDARFDWPETEVECSVLAFETLLHETRDDRRENPREVRFKVPCRDRHRGAYRPQLRVEQLLLDLGRQDLQRHGAMRSPPQDDPRFSH